MVVVCRLSACCQWGLGRGGIWALSLLPVGGGGGGGGGPLIYIQAGSGRGGHPLVTSLLQAGVSALFCPLAPHVSFSLSPPSHTHACRHA